MNKQQKLRSELKNLISLYGGDAVMDELRKVDPFKTESREFVRNSRARKDRERKAEYVRVSSLERFMSVVDGCSIYITPTFPNDKTVRFCYADHDVKYRKKTPEYVVRISEKENVIATLLANGWELDADWGYDSLKHKERWAALTLSPIPSMGESLAAYLENNPIEQGDVMSYLDNNTTWSIHSIYTSGSQDEGIKDVLRMANRYDWVQRSVKTADCAVNYHIADKLVKRGLLATSPDGFAYKITIQGKEFLQNSGLP